MSRRISEKFPGEGSGSRVQEGIKKNFFFSLDIKADTKLRNAFIFLYINHKDNNLLKFRFKAKLQGILLEIQMKASHYSLSSLSL